MIISHKHKFIFVRTKKTASTSIEIALSSICGDEDIITPIAPQEEIIRKELSYRTAQNYKLPPAIHLSQNLKNNLFRLGTNIKYFNHMPATHIKKLIGDEIWDSYYKFAFDRNPYDKTISFYYWRMRGKMKGKYQNLTEFLEAGELQHIQSYERYSINRMVAVDDVFRYEEIPESLEKLSQKLKLDQALSLPTYQAKSGTRKDKRHYREILTSRDREIIEIVFAREIKFMGYEF